MKKKKKKKPASLQSTQKPHFVPKIPTRPIRQTGYFDIDKYSHHFVIRNISPIGQQLLIKFATDYIEWGFAGFGRFAKRVPVKTFGARVRPLNHYHFHRGQWKEFVQFMANSGVDIKNIAIQEYGYYEPAPLNKPFTTEKTPRPPQVPVIEYFLSDNPTRHKLAEVQTGGGKANPLRTLIKVPGGWSTMGEMKVGTEIVTPKGTTARVSGVYPQGVKDIYRIVFADGRMVECCDEHLWKVHLQNRDNYNHWEVIDTQALMQRLEDGELLYIPLIESEKNADNELWVSAYSVGQILGELTGRASRDATAPQEYLQGSHQQRLQLLNGLLDIGGDVDEGGAISYRSESFNLARMVQYLVRSIGGSASIASLDRGYQVRIGYAKASELFSLEHKRARVHEDAAYDFHCQLRILKVEYVGQSEAQCISVDDDEHLYVIDNFVVTHNTLMASYAISKLNKRFVIFIKPQFIDKWISDVQELLGIERDEVAVIQGSDSLIATIHGVMSGELNPRAIIVSNRTFQTWIKNYEEKGNDITEVYGCSPPEFIQALRCGVRLVDEVHMDFHLNFKIDLYTHVERSISLSATLISDNPFIARMQTLAYPVNERYSGTPYVKYIDCYGIKYSIGQAHLLAQVGPTGQYSHNAFEKSIMVNKEILQGYLSFIEKLVNDHYFDRQVDGDKCLIYCSSIAMCTLVAEFLKVSFPDKTVRRYVEDDAYTNLLESDICVSTVLSAGTGHDIPGLITVILTHALNSSASNIQGFGRLRNLSGKKMVFVFLACVEVQKHNDYYVNKMKLLNELAQSLKETRIYDPIDRT